MRKRLIVRGFCVAATVFGVVTLANTWVLYHGGRAVYNEAESLSAGRVALVLGTAPRVGRWNNPFFSGRMDAAAELYRVGKVRHILVSGDNGRKTCDEPTAMRDALVERGVQATDITLDYAGFRTLDSVARA